MKKRISRVPLVLSVALVLGMLLPVPAGAKENFPLASAVPDNVFLCDLGRYNAERDFIDDYWGEVFAAVSESGIAGDFWELIGTLGDPEQQEEIDRIKQLGLELLEGVDWSKLSGSERACAMRMPALVKGDHGITAGGPDMIAILRDTPEGAAKNFAGLVRLVDTTLAEIGKAAGEDVPSMTRGQKMGAEVASLYPPQHPGAPHYGLSIAQKDDLLIIAIGDRILDECLGLMSGKADVKPLSKCPRFKGAFAELPAAEDGMTFFDMQRMLADLKAMTDEVFPLIEMAQGAQGAGDVRLNVEEDPETEALHKKAYESYYAKDWEGTIKNLNEAHAKSPSNSGVMYDLACAHALAGHKDEGLNWLAKAVDAGFYAPGHISRDTDLGILHDDPRYQEALEAAGKGAAASAGPSKLAMVRKIVDRITGVAGMMDYVAAVRYTEGHTTFEEEMVALAPGASKNSFYSVFGKRPPIDDFARYLPQETSGFSLTNGIEPVALYQWLEETVRELGPAGEQILAQWEGIQQEMKFHVEKDLLSWIEGGSVSASFTLGGTDAGVWMLKVTDENAARERLQMGLEMLSSFMAEMATQNPMAGMFAVRTSPATHDALEGFTNVFFGMQPQPAVCGVAEGHLIIGSSADAVALCMATAKGEHPNVLKNELVMSECLRPDGKFTDISYTNMRNLGNQIATGLGMASMIGGMAVMAIPPDVQPVMTKVLGMVGKLGPVATKIDFYKSSATVTQFKGKMYHTKRATNYFSPQERQGATASAL